MDRRTDERMVGPTESITISPSLFYKSVHMIIRIIIIMIIFINQLLNGYFYKQSKYR